MVKHSKTLTAKTVGFRATKDEVKMIHDLKKSIGIRADGDILRMALKEKWVRDVSQKSNKGEPK